MITIDIQHASQHSPLPEDAQLREWATQALTTHVQNANITLRIVDIAEMQQLNSYYRGKNKPTNVLSFPMEAEDGFLGDMVICAPIVMQEAMQQNKHWHAHWAHLVIHGCLHLLGFDHVTEKQAAVMEPLEIQVLDVLGYPNPY
ncbi:MAG: rRNA maturation RNase YbeY [Gammaproteobacteria bacterium]